MNREIEFRGLTFKGDWVYGDLTTDMSGLSFDEKMWIRNNLTENISEQTPTAYWQETTKRIHWNQGTAHCNAPVKEETVCQFIGLHDKYGTKIYEGDIIQYKNDIENGKGTVEFFSSCFHVVWFEQNTSKPSIWTTMNYLQCSAEIEVIGNIYVNPELIGD